MGKQIWIDGLARAMYDRTLQSFCAAVTGVSVSHMYKYRSKLPENKNVEE